jgi:hypothetical protein
MKKLLLVGIAALSVVTLSACEDVGYQYRDTPFVVIKKMDNDNRIIRDTNTGCMYWRSSNASIFPYYDKDGKVMGCGDKRKGADIYQ